MTSARPGQFHGAVLTMNSLTITAQHSPHHAPRTRGLSSHPMHAGISPCSSPAMAASLRYQ